MSVSTLTKSKSAIPSLYQYLYPIPAIIRLTSIVRNLTAEGIAVLAANLAAVSSAPVYGPLQNSTGTGFNVFIPDGKSIPGIS